MCMQTYQLGTTVINMRKFKLLRMLNRIISCHNNSSYEWPSFFHLYFFGSKDHKVKC